MDKDFGSQLRQARHHMLATNPSWKWLGGGNRRMRQSAAAMPWIGLLTRYFVCQRPTCIRKSLLVTNC